MVTVQAGWAFFSALAIAVVLALGLEHSVSLGIHPGGSGIAAAGAAILFFILLGLEILVGLGAAALAAWALTRSNAVLPPALPFAAAALGLILFYLMSVVGPPHFAPRAMIVFVSPALVALWVASRLAAPFPTVANLLTPTVALAVAAGFVAANQFGKGRALASEQRAKAVDEALSKDDVAAIDALPANGEEIDRYLAQWVNAKPTSAVLTRLLDSQHQSHVLDVLRTARAGRDPASSPSRALIPAREGWAEDIDSISLVFCAARDLPVGLAATVKRDPTRLEGALTNLLRHDNSQGAVRLLAAAGLLDPQNRLLPASYGVPGVVSAMGVSLEFTFEHTEPDLLLVYAVANGGSFPLKQLLERGAHADRAIFCGTTPLSAFLTRGQAFRREELQLLLSHGADPNRSVRGYCLGMPPPPAVEGTPLDLFAWRETQPDADRLGPEVLKVLVKAGAKHARPESLEQLRQLGAAYADALKP